MKFINMRGNAMKKHFLHVFAVSLITILFSVPVLANKTAVSIEAPASAQKGTVVTVKINVTHSGNSSMHHTEWVYVKVNDREVARWEFTKGVLPENENFTREIKVKADGPLSIEAQGNCNIHGSAGKVTCKVAVK
jgi:desulfoferrodoxin (superoxide reductase-like protein)